MEAINVDETLADLRTLKEDLLYENEEDSAEVRFVGLFMDLDRALASGGPLPTAWADRR